MTHGEQARPISRSMRKCGNDRLIHDRNESDFALPAGQAIERVSFAAGGASMVISANTDSCGSDDCEMAEPLF
jgi:hypothetical protein